MQQEVLIEELADNGNEGHQWSDKVELNMHADPFEPEDWVDEPAISPKIRQLILQAYQSGDGLQFVIRNTRLGTAKVDSAVLLKSC